MPLLLAIFFLITPTLVLAQDGLQPNTVTVSGIATVEHRPDRAVLHLAVESFAASASAASAENSKKMRDVLDMIVAAGIGRDQIRTIGFSVTPEYERQSDSTRTEGDDRVVGYRVRNTIEVIIDDLERVGDLIGGALAAGANRVTQLSFRLRDPDAARREALVQAVERARGEAETIARSVGRELGPVLSATTRGAFPRPQIMAARSALAPTADFSAAPPVEPGMIEVRAEVDLIFSLDPIR